MAGAIYLPIPPAVEYGWWNKQNSPYFYPYVFVSATSYLQVKDLRRQMKIDDDVMVFADSGGYALLVGSKTIDPYELATWYNSAGIDVGMTLDYPPYADEYKRGVKDFESRLIFTVKASKIVVEYTRSRVMLYACIHGVNWKMLDTWRAALDMVYDWDGYAFGVSPVNDPDAVLMLLRYIERSRIDKPIHVFECLDAVPFAMLARYANKKGITITTDSASAVRSGLAGWKYLTVLYNKQVPIGLKDEGDEVIRGTPECMCPVCVKFGCDKVRRDSNLIVLHNNYLYTWRSRFINSVSTEKPEVFKNFLPRAVPYLKSVDSIIQSSGQEGLEIWI